MAIFWQWVLIISLILGAIIFIDVKKYLSKNKRINNVYEIKSLNYILSFLYCVLIIISTLIFMVLPHWNHIYAKKYQEGVTDKIFKGGLN